MTEYTPQPQVLPYKRPGHRRPYFRYEVYLESHDGWGIVAEFMAYSKHHAWQKAIRYGNQFTDCWLDPCEIRMLKHFQFGNQTVKVYPSQEVA